MQTATRNCDRCGREYSRRRQTELGKYCSIACSAAQRRRDVATKCEQCGIQFSYRAGTKVRRFCSRACTADSLRRQVEHVCNQCGATFTRVPTQSGKHCSKECAYAARRKEETTGRRMIHAPGHPLALNGPLVPEYRVILYNAIGGGSHPCHHCGTSVEWNPGGGCSEGVLVVDHLDRNSLNNSLDNLVPSCQRCNVLNSERTIRDDEVFVVRKDGSRVRGERRNCAHCGAEFVAYVPKTRPNSGRFCSRSCARSKPKT